MSQSIPQWQLDNRNVGSPVPVAHHTDPREAMAEIAFHIKNLGYTDEEWDHDFYSGFMRSMKRIREIVKEAGH